MVKIIDVRFREFLPGAGQDSSGNPVQGKTRVVGRIDTNATYTKGGMTLTPADLELTVIDHLDLSLEEPLQGNSPSGPSRRVDYSRSAQQFYLINVTGAGVPSEAAANTDTMIDFVAHGDAVRDVVLR